MTESVDRVRPSLAGLRLGDERVPIVSGSLHYFRLSRTAWAPALAELERLGATLVDTYVPWSVHERARGDFDFGDHDPRLDLVGFLQEAAKAGLYVTLRPGPHVNAELTGFGIPERVLWDERCQARSRTGKPVILPFVPTSFPVPSYASRAFYDEATLWLARVAKTVSPLVWPNGPVVMVQVDNEGSLYFRDGPYDQDYHPDAIEHYRRFLRHKLHKIAVLRDRYEDDSLTFESVEPPVRFEADAPHRLARHIDWIEFQDTLLELALYRFRAVMQRNGLAGAVTFHNFPIAETAGALDAGRVERSVDFVALDYYHHASETTHDEIRRRTTALRLRSEARDMPAYAAEMGVGFPPYFPPLLETDNVFAAMTAFAYGLTGVNLYMAVGRDRWIGGAIDSHGRRRASADAWQRLFEALQRLKFSTLARRVPVRIVLPHCQRHLARATHAFGAVPPAAFAFSGRGVERGCLESVAGLSPSPALRTERFVRALETCLDRHRIPFALVEEDQLENSLERAAWTIVACPGALPPAMTERLARAIMGSLAVSIGPLLPERDASFLPAVQRLPQPDNAAVRVHLPEDESALGDAVERIARSLDLPTVIVRPSEAHATIFEDASGAPRAAFVINPTVARRHASIALPGVNRVRDALDGSELRCQSGVVALDVPGKSVVLLELDPPG